MKTSIIMFIMAMVAFMIVSTADYEMAVEDRENERELINKNNLASVADSLGLEGQDWINYVCGED